MAGAVPQLWSRQASTAADPSNAPTILGITGTMMALSFIVVSLRCWIRQVILKSFSLDDAIMVAALVMAIACMVCFIGMVQHGAGLSSKDIPGEWQEGLQFWAYIIGPFSTTGISLVKISVAFFLRRFVQQGWQRVFIIGMIIFCAVFMVYSILTFMLACIPLSAFWDGTYGQPGVKCWSPDTLSLLGTVNGVINVLADLVFVILPIPVVVGLQVNRRTKVTLVAILSLGLFACVASVARMVYAYQRVTDPNYTRNYNFIVWFNVELHAGILAASLPSLRPLFAKLLKNASSHLRSGAYVYNKSRYGNGYGNQSMGTRTREGYLKQQDIPMKSGNFSKDGYSAQVTTSRAKSTDGSSSEDGILAPKRGISKRTEVMWTVDDGKSRLDV